MRRTSLSVATACIATMLIVGPGLSAGVGPTPPAGPPVEDPGAPGARFAPGEFPMVEAVVPPLPRGPDVAGIHSSPYHDFDRNRIYDDLDRFLLTMGPGERVTVIALFTHPVDMDDVLALQADLGEFPVNSVWTLINGFSVDLTHAQILGLALRPDVVQLEKEGELELAIATARRDFGVDAAVSSFSVTGDRNGNLKSWSSTDVAVCILDTGYDVTRPDLNEGQLLGWWDFVNGQTTAYDDHGHGTHVAATLAGHGDSAWANRGVAYGAALVALKIWNSAGGGATDTRYVDAIQWCVNNRNVFGIKVINISGGKAGCWDGTDVVSVAANSAVDNGLVFVAAAGNEGDDSNNNCNVRSPAVASKAIAVCAFADTGEGGFFVADFSSRGPTASGAVKPDVCGPGVDIYSAVPTGTCSLCSSTGFRELSGTSMAAPFIAGVAALMKDASYTMTPATVKSWLKSQTHDWAGSGADNDVGSGRSLSFYAIKNAGGFSGGTPPAEPNHYQVTGETMGIQGGQDEWQYQVTSTSWPVAVTVTIPSASASKDFNLYLYRWTGTSWVEVAQSATTLRQEELTWTPTATGFYIAQVFSAAGTGSYYIDFSHVGTSPSLVRDD